MALEKISLVATILHTREEQESYAREMMEEEMLQGWKGLTTEARDLCELVGLPDVTGKYIGRKEVKEAVMLHNLKVVKQELAGLGKTKELSKIDLRKIQEFMLEKSLADSRMEVLWLTNMFDSRATMKGRYSKGDIFCPHCKEGKEFRISENPQHWMTCDAYLEFRQGTDPELIQKDRPAFLRRVVERRKELEADLRKSCLPEKGGGRKDGARG